MSQQLPLSQAAVAGNAGADSARNDGTHEVMPDLAYRRCVIANVVFVGRSAAPDRCWVLVDAGVFGTTELIASAAAERFGKDSRPAAIVMTHGHFDHVGGLVELAQRWDVPVYAHPLEHPYLNGTSAYPPPDPTVGGGLMSLLSPLYPSGPVDVSDRLRPLPPDGTVPAMPGWRWVHTPGHTVGHVSLWRESDRVIITGDAFISTRQESAYKVAVQAPELHGPPMYFTPNWTQAKDSVRTLAALEPEFAITGHGPPLHGAEMRAALHRLARDFDQLAVPDNGHYVDHPARAEDGTAYRPA